MAEESRPLQEEKLTLGAESRANVNTSDSLSGAGHAADHWIMGSSNQPISALKSEAYAAVKTSSGRSSSEPGNTERHFRGAGAKAGHQTAGISNQMISGNANMLKSGANNSLGPSERTRSGPGDGEANPANQLDDSYPSSLRSSSTCTSYSLEISLSTASDYKESQPLPLQTPPESRNVRNKQANPSSVNSGETNPAASLPNSSKASVPNPLQRCDQPAELAMAKVSECTDMLGTCQIITSKNAESGVEKKFWSMASSNGKIGAQPVLTGQLPKSGTTGSAQQSVQETEQMDSFSKEKKSSEDEEETFYAFVILHAQEDDEEATRLKSKLERITSTTGATFAEDFAEPGRSTFSCVEDAINNSAYTMLLLTANFNTRLNEMNADSAVMNSIEKPHKYNTVIPLLPRDNSLTKSELPMILRTKVQMKEKDGAFEIMAKKILHPHRIQMQKKIWKEEQLVRKQREKQRWLREENKRRSDFIRESAKVQELAQQRRQLLMQQQQLPQPQSYQAFFGGAQTFGSIPPHWQNPATPHYSGTEWAQLPSNIHIQNAKYIMIGNDSTMTVGADENNSGDED
ncbi:TIR domain-containing adapter molecule 1 [Salminus brasiliensis]|uniref:TIR domain-containing adapter molecule 1 n=1 Tax=Salminus brasiliensis TaxID=930266 RepID=UPI003B833A10